MIRIILSRVPGSKMGNNNAGVTGPAKVMLEEHGEMALEGLQYWQRNGDVMFELKELKESC